MVDINLTISVVNICECSKYQNQKTNTVRVKEKKDSNKIKNERGHIYHQYHRNPVAPADHEQLHANKSDNPEDKQIPRHTAQPPES